MVDLALDPKPAAWMGAFISRALGRGGLAREPGFELLWWIQTASLEWQARALHAIKRAPAWVQGGVGVEGLIVPLLAFGNALHGLRKVSSFLVCGLAMLEGRSSFTPKDPTITDVSRRVVF